MEKFIKLLEVTDPLAADLGIITRVLPYIEGKLLKEYLQDEYEDIALVHIYKDLIEIEDFETSVEPGNVYILGYEIGDYGISFIVSALAEYLVEAGVSEMVAGIIANVVVYAAVGGLMYLASSLLAPDMDGESAKGSDQSKAYQWGDISNTSKQMIPIPVVLGRFNVAGNLIAARTESFNVDKSGYSIQETLYLLFSLSSNELHELHQVTINGMDAEIISKDDITILYTYGTNDQKPLSYEYSDHFPLDDNLAPAADGPLFPDLSKELLYNKELVVPNHRVNKIVSTSKFIGYVPADIAVDLGSLNLDTSVNINLAVGLSPEPRNSVPDFRLFFKGNLTIENIGLNSMYCYVKVYPEIDGKVLTDYTNPPYNLYLKVSDAVLGDDLVYRTATEYILVSDIVVHDEDTNTLLVNFDIRTNNQMWTRDTDEFGESIDESIELQFMEAISKEEYYAEVVSDAGPDAVWDNLHYMPSDTWTEITSRSSQIDNIVFQFVLPRGMFSAYSGSHSGKDAGVKFGRWESYEFKLYQVNPSNGVKVAAIHFIPPDRLGDPSSIAPYYSNTDLQCPRNFIVSGSYVNSHSFDISAIDIVKERANFPNCYSTLDGLPYIHLVPETGFLPKGYDYEFRVRIHGHGNYGRGPAIGFSTVDPNITGASKVTDVYETRLYRVTEIDYDETLSYPNNTLLGIVLNSTPTVSGNMPTIIADCSFKVTYWNGSYWVKDFTDNPAHIVTALCYDDLWGLGFKNHSDISSILDLPRFEEFAAFCDKIVPSGPLQGEKNFTFNGIFDARISVWEAITQVCLVANGTPFFENGKITVYWEDDILYPVQVFSNVNILQGSFKETYLNKSDTAHAISGTYIDEDTQEKTSLIWMMPLGDPSKTVTIDLRGVTSRLRALRAIQYKLNKTNYLKKICEFQTTVSALNCQIGDKIVVQNEFVDWGNSDISGLIREISQSQTEVTLDRIFPPPVDFSDPQHASVFILFRCNSSDRIFDVAINSWDNTGEFTKIQIDSNSYTICVSPMDLFVIGVGQESFKSFTISTLDIEEGLTCRVEAVEYLELAQIDTSIFMLSSLLNPKLTYQNLCPRYITFDVDRATQTIEVSWLPPLVSRAAETEESTFVPIARYQIWRRKNALGRKDTDPYTPWKMIGETIEDTYTDAKVPVGFIYFYKIIPIFNYHGMEASMPLSWCRNFVENGEDVNPYLDVGVDLRWSIYDYLPIPTFIRSEVTESITNPTLVDYTFFMEDPLNWENYDGSEGFGIWWKIDPKDTGSEWLGPTNIRLSSHVERGSQYLQVNTTQGLTIPGLIIVGHSDLVYVHSASGNTLIVGHPTKCPYNDLSRKFVLGTAHNAGEMVSNAHKGFFPVTHFGFRDDMSIITEKKQVFCDPIYEIKQPSGNLEVGDLSSIVVYGPENYRPVFGKDNIVSFMSQFTHHTFIIPYIDPVFDDFTVNLAYFDIYGSPITISVVLWDPVFNWTPPIKKNNQGELYFTIANLPPDGVIYPAICRYKFNNPLGPNPINWGWTSHIYPFEE